MSATDSAVPRMALTRSVRTSTGARSGRWPRTSTWAFTERAPQIAAASSAKRSPARSAMAGSHPFSKRADASERRPRRREVRLIDVGSNQASSSRTSVVASSISHSAPPMIPAMPTGRSWPSQIRRSSVVNVRVASSRVTNVSPSTARRTRRVASATLARS